MGAGPRALGPPTAPCQGCVCQNVVDVGTYITVSMQQGRSPRIQTESETRKTHRISEPNLKTDPPALVCVVLRAGRIAVLFYKLIHYQQSAISGLLISPRSPFSENSLRFRFSFRNVSINLAKNNPPPP